METATVKRTRTKKASNEPALDLKSKEGERVRIRKPRSASSKEKTLEPAPVLVLTEEPKDKAEPVVSTFTPTPSLSLDGEITSLKNSVVDLEKKVSAIAKSSSFNRKMIIVVAAYIILVCSLFTAYLIV